MRPSYKRKKKGSLAEFGPVLIVFFLVILFPMLDLFAMAMGYASAYTLSQHWAKTAANSQSIELATNSVATQALVDIQSGLAKMCNLSTSGVKVYAVRTQIVGGGVQYIGPNEFATPPLNTTDYIYEYLVRTQFVQNPFVSLASVPWISNVPGLGKPWNYYVGEFKATEYLDGLVVTSVLSPGSTGRKGWGPGNWKTGWPP